MKMDPKVTKALKQLSVTTGLSLSITQTDAPDELVSRIQQLERAYKENYSEEFYLCGLLKKETTEWNGNAKSPFLRMNTGGYVIVIQWDSKACKPYCPKSTFVAPFDFPFRRPR